MAPASASFGSAILLASAATLLLPLPAAAAVLGLLAVLWWSARFRTGRWLVGLGLASAAVLAAAAALVERAPATILEASPAELEERYADLWREIAFEAERTAAELADVPHRLRLSLETFELFERQLERARAGDLSLLLLDPDGEEAAWAGPGFLHEPDPDALPAAGPAYRQGHTSATLLVVAPLSQDRRPWRLIAGRSLATDRLPFAVSGFESRVLGEPAGIRWWLSPARAQTPPGATCVGQLSGPALCFETSPVGEARRRRPVAGLRTAGRIVLGLTLLALPILRVFRSRRLPESRAPEGPAPEGRAVEGRASDLWSVLLTTSGFAAWSSAAGLGWEVTVLIAASVGLTSLALLWRRRPSVRDGGGELWGAAGALLLASGAWVFQHRFGRVDLASELGGSSLVFALRFALCVLGLGILRLAARRRGPGRGDRVAWAALVLLSAGAAFHDWVLPALALLAAGSGLAVRWLTGVDFNERPAAAGGLLVFAALLAGLAWEIGYREELRRDLAGDYLPKVSPPTREELSDLHAELFEYFDRRELGKLLDRGGGNGEDTAAAHRDLAYVLWRESPLAHRDGLSALVLEPASGSARSGGPSYFTFGLSLEEDLDPALDPARWQVPAVEAWRDAMVFGDSVVVREGVAWGRARYWFLPRPGFRLEVSELTELDAALVRGELHRKAVDGLPTSVQYGLYDAEGRAIVSPWKEAPPLPRHVLDSGNDPGRMDTPAGRFWFWTAEEKDGVEVLYLPVLEPFAGLQRVGVHAWGTLALVAVIVALAWSFTFSGTAFRALIERTVRSYSKRLILVYTVLLLLPLIALNLFLLRGFENRLRREQQADAHEAIGSARRFIQDYVKRLELGSSLLTRLDRQRLEWVASMVHHQVNLYWGSRLYTSSQRELFTVGLLPERIPGDIYRRLALLGQETDYRGRRRGEIGYRTYYAPLPVPGISPAQDGFFLSVPLLEQEEDVARELAAMRRHAVLATTALFFILTAVGSRLARSFTTPIMELIQGTRKIAAGAPYLEVTPRERELSSLADAIDDMAQRIAAGRRRLVLEKQVVERIVENITSAVVSIDHQRRVLLHNRVATELLGAEVGVALAATLARDARFEGLAEFLERASENPEGAPRQVTLKLPDADGESHEWSVIYVPLPGPEDPAAILVVDDVTEVVRGQRLEAWAEMARIIAHEIKNPLTPIQLSAEHMRQVYATDREGFAPVLKRCTDNILDQVAELREIASEFSTYSRIPQAEMVAGDLVGVMRDLTEAYRDSASRAGVTIDLICELKRLPAKFDRKLLGRAVRNLLENALRASAGRGRVELRLDRNGDRALLRVSDCGPGVEPGMLHRIFEPYFSTHESGTGLGLAITRRIVEEHGGQIEARNRPKGGLEVLTTLPISDDEARGRSC